MENDKWKMLRFIIPLRTNTTRRLVMAKIFNDPVELAGCYASFHAKVPLSAHLYLPYTNLYSSLQFSGSRFDRLRTLSTTLY